MIRLVGILSVPLWLITFISITLIGLTPHDDSTIRAFLQPTVECSTPCWEGIRPGITRIEEMTLILEENGWIRDRQFNYSMEIDTGLLTWRWRTPPSPFIESSRIGLAWIQNNVVQWIDLPTRLTFGDVWLLFDPPIRGAIQPASVIPRRINHYASYDENDWLQVRSTIFCPVRTSNFWQAPVNVLIGSLPIVEMKTYRLPHWSGCS
jgi:hypothetical protein